MRHCATALLALTLLLLLSQAPLTAQEGSHNVTLHVNPRWKQCSFQLDPGLSQAEWHEFTEEAGLVTYFRPLAGAQALGAGKFEVSILNWQTDIDDTKGAWNDTFVHPDSAHWLMEGDRLAFPGLSVRAGVSDRLDVAAYWTKSFGANYGFWGLQAQYAFLDEPSAGWSAAARGSFVSLYGPEDLGFHAVGIDLVASKGFSVFSGAAVITPFAGLSGYIANAHESSSVVDLNDEHVAGSQTTIGAEARVSLVRIAGEYSIAKVRSLSFKIGVGF